MTSFVHTASTYEKVDCSGCGHGPPACLCDFGDGVSGVRMVLSRGPHSTGRSFIC